MADITYIPIRQLYPHPDNPRKELGDLSELAASIKENGVYQNLTVIPGHLQDGTHQLFAVYGSGSKADTPCDKCKAAHPECDKCCKTCDDHCNAFQLCRKEYGE